MKNILAIFSGIKVESIFLPVIINSLKNLKNFLPLSLKKKVTNIVLNQQFDKNCSGGINLATSKCLDAFRLCNNND